MGAQTRTATKGSARPRRPRRRRRPARAPPLAIRTPAYRTERQSASASATRRSPRGCKTTPPRALAAQLPLTLSFRDHNAEKTAPLPRELPLDGAPAGHDPTAGDIGYWAPDADFVLYYDAPYFDGIVRICQFDGDKEAIALLPEGADVTIERAE